LLGQDPNDEQEIAAEENDLDICVTAGYESGEDVTLYRSTHHPVERAVLKGAYLLGRESQIEREAILGLYPRTNDLATAEYVNRRHAGLALLDKAEEQLSPEERRVVARLRYGQAQLYMFRVFGNAPPPGPERQKLHQSAIEECLALRRLLEPIIAASPEIDDVGMSYWAASNLARYYEASGVPDQALPIADTALSLVRDAAAKDPDEPDYQRWTASALQRLAGIQSSKGDGDNAVASMNEAIGILQRLYAELPNAGRRRDLKEALTTAIQSAREWKTGDPQVQQRWITMSSELDPTEPVGRSRANSKARRRSASKN
jgi:tetratricopeptide (TPR) repeat protein